MSDRQFQVTMIVQPDKQRISERQIADSIIAAIGCSSINEMRVNEIDVKEVKNG